MTSPFHRRIAALAILCAGTLFPACNRTPASAQDPESAANAFFATLENGDAQGAYNGAAFGFQAAQTFDGFISNARDLGLVGGKPPVWKDKQISAIEADFNGTLVNKIGVPINISVSMTPDGNAWKLFTLKTSLGSQDAENHFTLVGKGTGFNDVYHQPMPSPRQIDILVHKTVADFNTAIQTANFHNFYESISQQWRDGQRMTGDLAAGVTEKILKDHFQGFMDRKVDLSSIAYLEPVFDQTPQINESGLLELIGHFDTPDYRVNFSFQYAYELPFWKLFGIDISLTK